MFKKYIYTESFNFSSSFDSFLLSNGITVVCGVDDDNDEAIDDLSPNCTY